jgi:hypothetical protein
MPLTVQGCDFLLDIKFLCVIQSENVKYFLLPTGRKLLSMLPIRTGIRVTDKKSLGQPACPKEWKKYEERNE